MTDGLTLADVLGRDLSIECYEAVAVVRGATADLLDNPGQPNVLPALHQIRISPEGQINLTGGVRAAAPLRHLGQLLQAIVGQSAVPLQLRNIISQATAVSPAFTSIREYHEALAYFERPDRVAVLRSLYARASAAATVPGATPPTLETIAPLPKPERSQKAQKRPAVTARRRMLVLAGGAGLLVFGGAVGVRYNDPASRHGMSAVATRAADALASVMASGLSAASESLGLGRFVSPEEMAAQASPVGPVPPQKAPESSRKRPAVLDAQRGPFTAFDLEPAPLPADHRAIPSEFSTARPADASTIYSRESAGVSPPVSVHPALTRELPSNVNPQDLGILELVISAAGKVDSVRALDPRLNMQDSAWLGVVKAWEFQPAFKDGVPVKYRKTVWIAPRNRRRKSDARH